MSFLGRLFSGMSLGPKGYSFNAEEEAAKEAARKQMEGIGRAEDFQREMYQEARTLQDPFLQIGTQSFTKLSELAQQGIGQQHPGFSQELLGYIPEQRQFTQDDIYMDPGIQFAQEQAQRGIERSAAARGGVLGGGVLRELQRERMGLAGQQTGQAYNRFLGQQQLGQQRGLSLANLALSGRQQEQAEQAEAYNKLASIAQLGPSLAQGLGNQAIGQGARLGDLALQAGNVEAARSAAISQAEANRTNKMLNLLMTAGGLFGGGFGGSQIQANPASIQQRNDQQQLSSLLGAYYNAN